MVRVLKVVYEHRPISNECRSLNGPEAFVFTKSYRMDERGQILLGSTVCGWCRVEAEIKRREVQTVQEKIVSTKEVKTDDRKRSRSSRKVEA